MDDDRRTDEVAAERPKTPSLALIPSRASAKGDADTASRFRVLANRPALLFETSTWRPSLTRVQPFVEFTQKSQRAALALTSFKLSRTGSDDSTQNYRCRVRSDRRCIDSQRPGRGDVQPAPTASPIPSAPTEALSEDHPPQPTAKPGNLDDLGTPKPGTGTRRVGECCRQTFEEAGGHGTLEATRGNGCRHIAFVLRALFRYILFVGIAAGGALSAPVVSSLARLRRALR